MQQQATACHNDSAAAFPGAGERGGRVEEEVGQGGDNSSRRDNNIAIWKSQ